MTAKGISTFRKVSSTGLAESVVTRLTVVAHVLQGGVLAPVDDVQVGPDLGLLELVVVGVPSKPSLASSLLLLLLLLSLSLSLPKVLVVAVCPERNCVVAADHHVLVIQVLVLVEESIVVVLVGESALATRGGVVAVTQEIAEQ